MNAKETGFVEPFLENYRMPSNKSGSFHVVLPVAV